MNLRPYLSVPHEVQTALRTRRPIVAMESNMLFLESVPDAPAFARELARAVSDEGAVPALLAVVQGKLCIGLSAHESALLCAQKRPAKASRRDLPVLVATGRTGALTVAASMILASLVGVPVLCTSGVGGVHKNAAQTMDISADLQELRQSSIAVVSTGVNPHCDIPRTLEYLETMGVPVLGLGTNAFPEYDACETGFSVNYCARDEAEVARIAKTKWNLGLRGGVLVANPVFAQASRPVCDRDAALANARAAARIAAAYAKL